MSCFVAVPTFLPPVLDLRSPHCPHRSVRNTTGAQQPSARALGMAVLESVSRAVRFQGNVNSKSRPKFRRRVASTGRSSGPLSQGLPLWLGQPTKGHKFLPHAFKQWWILDKYIESSTQCLRMTQTVMFQSRSSALLLMLLPMRPLARRVAVPDQNM